MKEPLCVSRRIYLRSVRFVVPLLAVFAASIVFLYSLNKSTNDLDYLKDSLQLGVLGILFFSISSYEMMSLSHRMGCSEAISAQCGAHNKLCLAHFFVQTIALLVWSLFLLIWHFVRYSLSSSVYTPYYIHIAKSVFLYCIIPCLVAILLGCSISKANRPLAYSIIILFVILSSSLPSRLFSWYQSGDFSFARFHDWFQLAVPNSNWVSDAVYGIGLEESRFVIAGFWVLFLCAIALKVLAERVTLKLKISTFALVALAAIFAVSYASRHSDYIMYKDDRPDGIVYSEYNYRMDNTTTILPASANYAIESYDMQFDIGKSLSCCTSIFFEHNSLSEYAITLYHGYAIENVCDLDGTPLKYSRNTDYITVYSANPLRGLRITYSGKSAKYYANSSAVMLPGYFPYYPMPGYLQVWDSTTNSFLPITDLPETHFDVSVRSNLGIFSNLSSIEANTFSGRATSVTLYAGLVDELEIDNTRYIFSPLSGQEIGLSSNLLSAQWDDIANMLGIDEELTITGKTVFYQPFTIRSASGNNESVVVLDDHILLCDLSISSDIICSRYLMQFIPENENTSTLRRLFFEYFYSCPDRVVVEKPDYSEIEVLGVVNSINSFSTEEEMIRYLLAEESFADLLLYQIGELGEDYTLRAIYEYLTADTVTQNQTEFLYNLGGNKNG